MDQITSPDVSADIETLTKLVSILLEHAPFEAVAKAKQVLRAHGSPELRQAVVTGMQNASGVHGE